MCNASLLRIADTAIEVDKQMGILLQRHIRIIASQASSSIHAPPPPPQCMAHIIV